MSEENLSPGRYFKKEVLMRERVSLSKAAERLGISRVTLSKIVNGQSPLTSNVAIRMENVFGLSAETLLTLQMQTDIKRTRTISEAMKDFSYPFHVIKAHNLEVWADTIASRTELLVLIRRLSATTGTGITR